MKGFKQNLDKRTKELDSRKISSSSPGQAIAEQQLAQNQLQAIQNEQRANLLSQKQDSLSADQTNDLLGQAAMIGVSSGTMGVLGKYGLKSPPSVKQYQKRDVNIAPNKIMITNNNTTNTTNNIQGSSDGSGKGGDSATKFKTWLNKVFVSQREAATKRNLEYEKRESSLARGANKMLKRIEATGREVASTLNPANIGQTVGNQLKILLMLFGMTFLSKHWDTVLNAVKFIGDTVQNVAAWFGLGDKGHALAARGEGMQNAIVKALGGDPKKKETIFDAIKGLAKEFADLIKMKLDHAMELRGEAIKSIKFPSIDLTNIGSAIGGLGTYLGNILQALVDPKSAMHSSIKNNIKSTGLANSLARANNWRNKTFAKNTDFGDASITGSVGGKKNYSLDRTLLDSSGNLNGSAISHISQSQDILGAIHDAKETGRLDTSRMAAGLQRLQDQVERKGLVTVSPEFIAQFYDPATVQALTRGGHLKTKQYKYVRVKRTQAQKDSEEKAYGFLGGAARAYGGRVIGGKINELTGMGGDLIGGALVGNGDFTQFSAASPFDAIGENLPLVGGLVRGVNTARTTLVGGIEGGIRGVLANDYTLKLVPAEDNSYGGAFINPSTGKPMFQNFYTLDREALNKLALNLGAKGGIDSSDQTFLNGIRNRLIKAGGGLGAMKTRYKREVNKNLEGFESLDIPRAFDDIRAFDNTAAAFEAQERAATPRLDAAINYNKQNINNLIEGASDFANSAYNTISGLGTTLGIGGSDDVMNGKSGSTPSRTKNWLWGGTAPTTYSERDKAKAQSLQVSVKVPIHNLSGKTSSHTLVVNKKLAADVKKIFEEIYTKVPQFRISTRTTSAFCFRTVNNGSGKSTNKLSNHSYGGAIDINWDVNPLHDKNVQDTTTHLGTTNHPVVQIFLRHGWIWGGGWRNRDKMHFEFGSIISNINGEDVTFDNYSEQSNISSTVENEAIYDENGNVIGYTNPGGGNDMAYGTGVFAGTSVTGGDFSSSGIGNAQSQIVGGNVYTTGDYAIGAKRIEGWNYKGVKVSAEQQKLRAGKIMERLMREGLTKEQAAGVIGNLLAESGLASEYGELWDVNGNSSGLAMWHDNKNGVGNLNNLKKFAAARGKSWQDFDTQLEFLVHDMKTRGNGKGKFMDMMKTAGSVEEAARLWGRYYEVFAGYNNPNSATYKDRIARAKGVMALQSTGETLAGTEVIAGTLGGGSLEASAGGKEYAVLSWDNKESNKRFCHDGGGAGLAGDSWGVGMKSFWPGAYSVHGCDRWCHMPTHVSYLVKQGSKVIVVYCGLNSLQEPKNWESGMLQTLEAAQGAALFFCLIVDVPASHCHPRIHDYNQFVANFCKAHGIGVIDCYSSSASICGEGNSNVANDGFHLKNYRALASLIFSQISGVVDELTGGDNTSGGVGVSDGSSSFKIPTLSLQSENERAAIQAGGVAADLYLKNSVFRKELDEGGMSFTEFNTQFQKMSEDDRKKFALQKTADLLWSKYKDEKEVLTELGIDTYQKFFNTFMGLPNSEKLKFEKRIRENKAYLDATNKMLIKDWEGLSDEQHDLFNRNKWFDKSDYYSSDGHRNNDKNYLEDYEANGDDIISEENQKKVLNALINGNINAADSIFALEGNKFEKDNKNRQDLYGLMEARANEWGDFKSAMLASEIYNPLEQQLVKLGELIHSFDDDVKNIDLKYDEERNGFTEDEKAQKHLALLDFDQLRNVQAHLTDDFLSTNDNMSVAEKVAIANSNKKIAKANQMLQMAKFYYDPDKALSEGGDVNNPLYGATQELLEKVSAEAVDDNSGVYTLGAKEKQAAILLEKYKKQYEAANRQKFKEIDLAGKSTEEARKQMDLYDTTSRMVAGRVKGGSVQNYALEWGLGDYDEEGNFVYKPGGEIEAVTRLVREKKMSAQGFIDAKGLNGVITAKDIESGKVLESAFDENGRLKPTNAIKEKAKIEEAKRKYESENAGSYWINLDKKEQEKLTKDYKGEISDDAIRAATKASDVANELEKELKLGKISNPDLMFNITDTKNRSKLKDQFGTTLGHDNYKKYNGVWYFKEIPNGMDKKYFKPGHVPAQAYQNSLYRPDWADNCWVFDQSKFNQDQSKRQEARDKYQEIDERVNRELDDDVTRDLEEKGNFDFSFKTNKESREKAIYLSARKKFEADEREKGGNRTWEELSAKERMNWKNSLKDKNGTYVLDSDSIKQAESITRENAVTVKTQTIDLNAEDSEEQLKKKLIEMLGDKKDKEGNYTEFDEEERAKLAEAFKANGGAVREVRAKLSDGSEIMQIFNQKGELVTAIVPESVKKAREKDAKAMYQKLGYSSEFAQKRAEQVEKETAQYRTRSQDLVKSGMKIDEQTAVNTANMVDQLNAILTKLNGKNPEMTEEEKKKYQESSQTTK